MKKVTSILMAFVLMLTLIPTAWAEGESVKEWTATDSLPEYGTYKLMNDVTLTNTHVVKGELNLDLNGKTVKNESDLWDRRPGDWSLISVRDSGSLTITGSGTLHAKENDCYAIDVQDVGATVTIQGGVYEGNIHAVYVYEGKANIQGGTYSVQQKFSATQPDQFVLNLYDKSRVEGKATIVVTGGTFLKFNPADCEAEGKGTNFVHADYKSVKGDGDTYTVVPKDYVAQIGDTKYVTLADAVAVGGDIKLLKDVTLTRGLAINKDITLDLNGKTLEHKNGYIFDVYSNMTVKNGTVKFSEKPAKSGAAIWVNKTAKLTVESNVTVEAPDNCFDIAYYEDCTAAEVILRGKLVGGSGVTMNGNIGAGTSNKLTVDGATIDVTGHGIYQAGCADTNFTINNSVITGGSTGIEVRAGKLTVTNSTITGEGKFAVKPNGNGATTDGAGIAIAQHTTKQPIDVTIAGGTVTGEYAVYESNPQKNSAADIAKVKVAVTGGTFNGKIYSKDITGFVTGGTFNTNPKDYVPAADYTVAKKDGVYTVAEKDPDKDGTGETTSAVKLEVPATSGGAVINTTVDQNDIETNKELTVTNGKTAVTINQVGVNEIGAIDLKLDIKADSKTPESANTAAYNKAMAGKDANSALVVNISLTNGASKLFTADVANAYALVTVPYSTDKADKLTVYYLNGSDATALTKVADAAAPGAALNTFSYDAPNKLITLKLPHFSEYLISTTATRSVVHHYGGTGTTTITGTKTNSPTTFDAGVGIYAVSAILSVTGMAWVGTKQRKH